MDRKLWLLLLACVVLAGCRLDTKISTRITSEGFGYVDIFIQADEEFASNYALTGRDLDLEIRRRALRSPQLSMVESTDLSWHMQGLTQTPEDLSALLENLSPAFREIAIEKGDLQTFTVDFEAFETAEEIDEVLRGVDPSEINAQIDVILAVELPGLLEANNGDRVVNGETVEWTLSGTGDRVLRTESNPGGRFPIWTLLLIAASLGGGWFLRGVFGYLEERTFDSNDNPRPNHQAAA